jgi:hypothetical protein
MVRLVIIAFWAWAWFLSAPLAAACQSTDRIISLEIKTPGAASENHQQWAEILADVGADRVKITSSDDARPAVDESEYSGQTIIRVTGVLSRDGKLTLPGASFGQQDAGRIREWIAKLRADGAKVALSEKMAFGLTAEQLVALNETLAQAIDFETKGQTIGDVVSRIQREIGLPLQLDESVRAKLSGSEVVAEELKGLAAGTVLAATIRPLGLVVVPTRPVGGAVELAIVDSRSADEHWPIGWPLEVTPAKAAPILFERFNFDLTQAPLSDALAAIEKKTQVPFLYDHNSFARAGVELAKVRVDFHRKRQTYFRVVDDLLSQSRPRLKLELRVDEAQRPFLWISAPNRP